MIKLTNLNSVIADSKLKEYEFQGMQFKIERIKNDINGNPLYRIVFYDFTLHNKIKGKIGKTYMSKGYTVFQSYNVSDSLKSIFDLIKEVK